MKITYRTSKEVSASAMLSLFRRNEWREWFTLEDTDCLGAYVEKRRRQLEQKRKA